MKQTVKKAANFVKEGFQNGNRLTNILLTAVILPLCVYYFNRTLDSIDTLKTKVTQVEAAQTNFDKRLADDKASSEKADTEIKNSIDRLSKRVDDVIKDFSNKN